MRTRSWPLATLLLLVVETVVQAKPAKPSLGVFGKIHGKPFKAISTEQTDGCVNAIFKPADAIVALTALECRSRRVRAPKKNYKVLVLACSQFDTMASRTPPYEIPCIAGSYTEYKKVRRAIVPVGVWVLTVGFPMNSVQPTSTVTLRVESFDGTVLRAKALGVFDDPQTGSGTAAIAGELAIDVPVTVQ